MAFSLGVDALSTDKLHQMASKPAPAVQVNPEARQRLKDFRAIVDKALLSGETYYGINTGFGYLSNVRIDREKLEQLQQNIIRSHACGVGDPLKPELSRAILILRAHTFLLGHSGITEATLDTIIGMIKHDVLPVIPQQGSVGASGDLAPLAHVALALMGEGRVFFRGNICHASEAMKVVGIEPISPKAKEGLSLINGTHFMTAIAAFAIEEAKRVATAADVVSAMSLDACRGTLRALDARIHDVRGQSGQTQVAANIRKVFCETDEIMQSHKDCTKVQDPYSFRCTPQVHGASRDAISYVENIVNRELNAITDNPIVFQDGDILSGGNFHGQPVALAMDFLGIAMAEIGSISEQRIMKLTNPVMSDLPAFLTEDSGLNSGYMIPHVVAASLVSENKILAHPASVDSIPTSADKEDHVSMGPIAARKARNIIQNVATVVAIELLAACQGLDLLKPLRPNRCLAAIYGQIRKMSPTMDRDRSLEIDIKQVCDWILSNGIGQTLDGQNITLC